LDRPRPSPGRGVHVNGIALAAGLKDASDYRGKSIAVVIRGRNIALDTFRSVLDRAPPSN